jgi:hypothetical protein
MFTGSICIMSLEVISAACFSFMNRIIHSGGFFLLLFLHYFDLWRFLIVTILTELSTRRHFEQGGFLATQKAEIRVMLFGRLHRPTEPLLESLRLPVCPSICMKQLENC